MRFWTISSFSVAFRLRLLKKLATIGFIGDLNSCSAGLGAMSGVCFKFSTALVYTESGLSSFFPGSRTGLAWLISNSSSVFIES